MSKEKSLLEVFNDRVIQLSKELGISQEEAFLKVVMITYAALEIYDSILDIILNTKENNSNE